MKQGKRDDTLELEMQSLSTSERAKAVNNLLSKKRLLMLRDNDGTLRYKPVPADEAQLFKGLSREDQVVHDVIKSSGNRGMWTKDLRERSELSQNQVMKSLKTLEKKELIKSVRSVTNKNRKVYMLASLDPSEEVTGGQWYTDEQFDSTFINTLRDASRAVIQRSSCATVDEVYRAVEDSQVVNVELTVEHISQIVRTLHLDGDIELWHDDGNGHFRMPTKHYRPTRFKEVSVLLCDHLFIFLTPHLFRLL